MPNALQVRPHAPRAARVGLTIRLGLEGHPGRQRRHQEPGAPPCAQVGAWKKGKKMEVHYRLMVRAQPLGHPCPAASCPAPAVPLPVPPGLPAHTAPGSGLAALYVRSALGWVQPRRLPRPRLLLPNRSTQPAAASPVYGVVRIGIRSVRSRHSANSSKRPRRVGFL